MKPKHEVVCFGELLWDILPDAELPGGAPMNVAYHLQKAGLKPALITRLGKDERGQKLIDIVSGHNITTEYFQFDNEHSTGIVYANVSDAHEVSYDIVFPSAWDYIQLNNDLLQLVAQSKIFVYGSLSSRHEVSGKTLYALLEAANTKLSDINLRAPYVERTHIEYLLTKADIVKMNETELAFIADWYASLTKQEDQIAFLKDKFNLETLIVTLGADGAVVNHQGTFFRHAGFRVQVADTIGSGDAFLAGYLSEILKGYSGEKALEYASALGAFTATHNGACPAYNESVIKNFIKERVTETADLKQ